MIKLTTSALELFEAGISVIPCNELKEPSKYVKSWTKNQKSLIKPNGEFDGDDVVGIGAVCGVVSGGLEIMDFDLKYDLTGTLMKDYRKALNDEVLLKKLVIQKTVGGGFHFLYRCEEIEGNQSFARREATEQDREIQAKKLYDKAIFKGFTHEQSLEKSKSADGEKVKVLIETRGEKGYFLIAPSSGYEIIQGDIRNIPILTVDERKKLHDCARTFNEYFPPEIDYKQQNITKQYEGVSPFDDYCNRGDIISVLEAHGWKQVGVRGDCGLFRRPGKDEGHSASYHTGLKTFRVYTTSSEFEGGKAYNHVGVYNILVNKGDYTKTSKDLFSQGYGDRKRTVVEDKKVTAKKEVSPAENTEFDVEEIFNMDEAEQYLESVRNGTFERGLSTGMNRLDNHFRFKKNTFVICNGHDNVGKSLCMWFLMLISAKRYDWKWIVYTGENSKGAFTKRMIELLTNTPLTVLSQNEYNTAKTFIYNHFFVIGNKDIYDAEEMMKIIQTKYDKVKCDGVLIDPYNALDIEDTNAFQKHMKAILLMQNFTRRCCSLYLVTHAVTGAVRKLEDGYIVAPQRADTENGGRFAAKADDFLTFHRLTNHEFDWMYTQIHVRKIKEYETGGMPTPKDRPVRIRMMIGNCGFVDDDYVNPITEVQYSPADFGVQERQVDVKDEAPRKPSKSKYMTSPDSHIEPQKDDDEIIPFDLNNLPF
jgi:hypothetical protein